MSHLFHVSFAGGNITVLADNVAAASAKATELLERRGIKSGVETATIIDGVLSIDNRVNVVFLSPVIKSVEPNPGQKEK